MNNSQLEELAKLIHSKNKLEDKIAGIINRPAEKGHIGEYIASIVFDIELNKEANHKGSLAGSNANIKWSGKQEGLLNLIPEIDKGPDYYLVLTGPKGAAISSRGTTRPSLINFVFLFNAKELIPELKRNGVKIGIATSVRKHLWDKAEIYPQINNTLLLTDEQKNLLKLFAQS